MKIKVGQPAPQFQLKDRNGKVYDLRKMKAKHVVVFFYPKDNTPGCTIEAKSFNGSMKQFAALDAMVVGISGGDEKTKAAFCKKHGLQIPLLSDSDFKVSKAWGSFGEKSFMGKKFKGILRQTFIVDDSMKVVKMFSTVMPEVHTKEVLQALKDMSSKKPMMKVEKKVDKKIVKKPLMKSTAKKTGKTPVMMASKAPSKKSATKRAVTKKMPVKAKPMAKAAPMRKISRTLKSKRPSAGARR